MKKQKYSGSAIGSLFIKTAKLQIPNFIIAMNEDNEEAIFRIVARDKTTKVPSSMKEVVHIERAKEIIAGIHRPGGQECLPYGPPCHPLPHGTPCHPLPRGTPCHPPTSRVQVGCQHCGFG